MPYKTGGGGMPELYDPDNGQYTDEQKSKLLDTELSNIVLRYIFGLSGTFEPRYPIYGFHSDEYCELYVRFRICKNQKYINYDKIDNYLLKPLLKNDKSLFFKLHGYDISRRNELYKQLILNTDMTKMKFDHLNEFGILVNVPTQLYSYKEKKNILIYTVWIYKKDEWFHFVTVNLKKRGNNHD